MINEIAFRVMRQALKRNVELGPEKVQNIQHTMDNMRKTGKDTGTDEYPHVGSARVYLHIHKMAHVKINGKDAHMDTGLKVSRYGFSDIYHVRRRGNMSLGAHQTVAETHPANNPHRVLIRTKQGKVPEFQYNPHGVLPPLLKHDQKHHEWSVVGHATPVSDKEIRRFTTTEDHHGFDSEELGKALTHAHHQRAGVESKYGQAAHKRLADHPIFQKFNHYHASTGIKPGDYNESNLGIWHHPITGKSHLILLDHGFNEKVRKIYGNSSKTVTS